MRDRDRYHQVVMTCLYISVKVHERQALTSHQLADLSRGKFTPQQIEELEIEIGGTRSCLCRDDRGGEKDCTGH